LGTLGERHEILNQTKVEALHFQRELEIVGLLTPRVGENPLMVMTFRTEKGIVPANLEVGGGGKRGGSSKKGQRREL